MFLHLSAILFTVGGSLFMSRGVSVHVQGGLCPGPGGLCQGDPPVWKRVSGTYPTGMHSCARC